MIGLTVVVHAVGIIVLGRLLHERGVRNDGPQSLVRMVGVLVFTVLAIIFVHTIEIWFWALLYVGLGTFEVMERALYFSIVTFTTLGYGDITLLPRWQLLGSFEAVNGIILFGVSAAFVVDVVRRMYHAQPRSHTD